MPSGRTKIEPVRWSITRIANEFGVTGNKFRSGCRAANVKCGEDQMYSTRQVVEALFSQGGLEKRAKAARLMNQIEEAEHSKIKRQESQGKLVSKAEVQEFLTDAMLRLTQIVRHSKLPQADKARAIHELNTVEFKKGKMVVDK